ncbi:hypothetical protein DL764_009382 [Monosporascus ibericus]|uniref:Glucose-methanol-choline oxidoreductase N-terminal domain-containing protein n=1 Tax=Monosporascus ibericus TaxID=155417 RepID=A0A4V1X900_9PEZI|nr:hypothetical protein DL764_009382 [Monosporascus ibericus]
MMHRLFKSPLVLAALRALVAAAPTQGNEYEYVVVGSGAGGGTVAASLARKGHSVFLIEAGGDHGTEPLQTMPFSSETDKL